MARLPRPHPSTDAKGFARSLKHKVAPEEDDIEEQPAKNGSPKPLQASRSAINENPTASKSSPPPDVISHLHKRPTTLASVRTQEAGRLTILLESIAVSASFSTEAHAADLITADLAGAGRVCGWNRLMKDTESIDFRLSPLEDVPVALGSGPGVYVWYRTSKMVLSLFPLAAHLKESLTSLRFANREHHESVAKSLRPPGDLHPLQDRRDEPSAAYVTDTTVHFCDEKHGETASELRDPIDLVHISRTNVADLTRMHLLLQSIVLDSFVSVNVTSNS
ncbi:hypothetical protein B0H17DRAFT_1135832 [Mycena rosella]|uniref:Uncharacterized protein n=1 Tax=Mycena rosella TaxID=1033263 RepID=A0AAD7GHG5_MYCRO|nr:hypothetical protein B0H17DRAFT_1135832 [Mycena rosella]